jgi:peptide/nickel transport system substrate-binding protein
VSFVYAGGILLKKFYVGLAAIAVSVTMVSTPVLSATKTTKKAKGTTKKVVTTTAPATTIAPVTTKAATGSANLPADADPNGTLRIGNALLPGQNYIQFDLTKMATPGLPIHALVYDTLLRQQPDGTFKPGLAKSAKVEGDKVISIELQPNVKFSDGTVFDADAVKAGLERNVAANNPGSIATEMKQIDKITVTGPLKLTLQLKTPIAGFFYQFLSRGEMMIASPTAVAKGQDMQTKPVGAGPFLLESIAPEQKVRLVKNPNYFQADRVRLAAVEYIHVADPTALNNAMLAGQIDAADAIQVQSERALRGDSRMNVAVKSSDATNLWGSLCKSTGPLADVRVRQALNYGIDRDVINKIVYEGKGEPLDALVKTDNVLYDKKYKDFYKRNVDKAKKLLADAGYPNGVTIDFFYSAGDSQTASEIIQQQLKDIGVTLNLALSSNLIVDFFTTSPKRPGYVFPLQRIGLDKITRNLQPGSIGNICNYNDEELNKVIEILRSKSLDDPASKQYWNLMTDVVLEKALFLFVDFGVSRNVNSDKVGNVSYLLNFGGLPYIDIPESYKKK